MATTSNSRVNPGQTQRRARTQGQAKAQGPVAVTVQHSNAVALNFVIGSDILASALPAGLVVDHHKGDTFISLVCMQVRKIPFCGMPIVPGFCELSLRCFVSERENPDRKGVLILKSYASGSLGPWVLGNIVPMEHGSLPIKSQCKTGKGAPELDYGWKIEGHENRMRIRGRDQIMKMDSSSKLGFILAHRSRYLTHKGITSAYDVTSPEWAIWDAAQANFTCDVRRLFGAQYVKPLGARPISVYVSEGSMVKLHKARKI